MSKFSTCLQGLCPHPQTQGLPQGVPCPVCPSAPLPSPPPPSVLHHNGLLLLGRHQQGLTSTSGYVPGALQMSYQNRASEGVKSLSRVRLSATPWTEAYQAPVSMGFSRQEYWSRVPLPSPFIIYYHLAKKKTLLLKQTIYVYFIIFVTFFSLILYF